MQTYGGDLSNGRVSMGKKKKKRIEDVNFDALLYFKDLKKALPESPTFSTLRT